MKPYSKTTKEETKKGNKTVSGLLLLALSVVFVIVVFTRLGSYGKQSSYGDVSVTIGRTEEIASSANAAYEKDDYATALSGYRELVNLGSNDGEIFYKLAYSEFQVEKTENVNAFLKAWQLLKRDNKSSPYYEKALKNAIHVGTKVVVPTSNAEISIASVGASTSIGDPAYGIKASDGATLVKIIHSIKNKSVTPISLYNIPGISLYGPEGEKYSRDNLKSASYNSQIENPVDGGINPGIKKNLANVFEVPEEKWSHSGWYVVVAGDTLIPLK